MRKYIPKFVAGLAAISILSGCGLVNMAGRPKASGTENAPGYESFHIQSVLGEEPKEDGLKKAIWMFQKGDLYLASAKTEEYSENRRKARLAEAVELYEKGLGLVSKDIEEFYRHPYKGFKNKSLSTDFLNGVFGKSLSIYREIGNSARAAFALHHLDWISWNRQKMELHKNGLSIDAIERMEKDGILVDLITSKYNSLDARREEISTGAGTGEFDSILREARNRKNLASKFKIVSASPGKIYLGNKPHTLSSQGNSLEGDKLLLIKRANSELSYEDRKEQVAKIMEQRRIEQIVRIKEDCQSAQLGCGDPLNGRAYSVKVGN